ncbi:hypothetical protein OIU84_011608 [Salix udensis]|uniref:BTB domain-containing protein n=1 Tax=Salix udensis TaxID=889485 RepID=A0AAD6NWV6_9ROSI|nr:hypothetical protein OIU84_011608 [Salix udensis]
MTLEDSLRSLSLDYLNLLINGQAFSDVTFSVEGRLVHAHRCILAARSLFFRKFFCGPDPPSGLDPSGSRINTAGSPGSRSNVIPVNSVGSCWHTHCTSAVDLALDTLAAARYFGVEQLAMLTQKQLASMVEKVSNYEDVMKVLIASRRQGMDQLWTTCSHLVAKSGLPQEVLAKHLPTDVVAKIEELRLKSSIARRSLMHHHHLHDLTSAPDLEGQKIRRMKRALDSSDVELVKLMHWPLHYAAENCSREVVKALLELGAADVNYPAGPAGKTPLHIAAEMVSPDMVSVLLDHHADPNVRTVDGVTPLDILRTLTSDFLFKGAVPGLAHIEPNKLRLCLELVQSAANVLSREEGNVNAASTPIYPSMSDEHNTSSSGTNLANLNLDSRMVYLNLGAAGSGQMGSRMEEDDDSSHNNQRDHHAMSRHDPTMYHHHSHDF